MARQVELRGMEHGVFLRNATGLVREISAFGAIAIGSFALSIGAALAFVLTAVPNLYPGANVALSVVFAAGPALLVAYLYSSLTSAMPRSGGEYVWLSRLLWSPLGFTMAFGFFVTQLVYAAANLDISFSWFLNGFFFLLGTVTGNDGLIDTGAFLSRNSFWFGTGLNVLILLFMFLPTPKQMRFVVVAFAIAMVSVVTLALVLLVTSDFAARFTNDFGQGAIARILADARAAGARTEWSVLPSLIAVAYVVQYLPMTYVAMYSGEIRNARRNAKIAIYWATGLFIVSLLVISLLLYKTVGYGFMSAVAYLEQADPSSYPFAFPFTVNYAVLLVSKSSIIITIASLGFILFSTITAVTILFAVTRVVFAFAWDRLFPDWVARVNPRTASPVNSALAVFVIVEICLWIFHYTTAFLNLVFGGIAYLVLWFGVGATAALLPYRRRELWEASDITKRRVLGIPLISIVGAVVALLSVVALPYLFISGAGVINSSVVAVLLVFYVGGPILYFSARAIRKAQGVNLDAAYREIPAE